MSAYNIQFMGSYSNFKGNSIWKMETEGIFFFAWLLVQCKLLTVYKLMARQWPCNPMCSLCNSGQETIDHLILHCSFARNVWTKMAEWTQNLVQQPTDGFEVMDWLKKELAQLPKKDRRLKATLLIYGAWNIWKERNSGIFEQKQMSPGEVL